MTTILLIAHLIVCFFMIFIVLIQSGKGAELGAAFGGSSQTLFGARGAATFFSKLTTSAAVIFMLTSLLLAITTNKQGSVIPKSTHLRESGRQNHLNQHYLQFLLNNPNKSSSLGYVMWLYGYIAFYRHEVGLVCNNLLTSL
jgi:preprotein translocase subunit SecG